jgi:hypothetical protein
LSTSFDSNNSETTSVTTTKKIETASENESEKVDPNIEFVEVQTLLFGNTPNVNPKSIFLKNHEPTKASQKKCGLIKSYAANTN